MKMTENVKFCKGERRFVRSTPTKLRVFFVIRAVVVPTDRFGIVIATFLGDALSLFPEALVRKEQGVWQNEDVDEDYIGRGYGGRLGFDHSGPKG